MSDSEIYSNITKALENGERLAIVTIVKTTGSTPRKIGAKMIVYQDGRLEGSVGGGPSEALIVEEALDTINKGKSVLRRYELPDEEIPLEQNCGGSFEVFIEIPETREYLLIFGGGHIGYHLARIGKELGFSIIVIDDREEFLVKDRFPMADYFFKTNSSYYENFPCIGNSSYIVIVTRCHKTDEAVLRNVIMTDAKYIGMIGSRNKVKKIMENLKEDGFDEKLLERVHAPVGLEIGAETPAEIAISIMAEIVKIKRLKNRRELNIEVESEI